MRFVLSRTSIWTYHYHTYTETAVPPVLHDKQIVERFIETEQWVVDKSRLSLESLDRWHLRGWNHHEENGVLKRDHYSHRYYIDFETIEDLMAFVGEVGYVVITTDRDGLPTIEIYDGYRE